MPDFPDPASLTTEQRLARLADFRSRPDLSLDELRYAVSLVRHERASASRSRTQEKAVEKKKGEKGPATLQDLLDTLD